MTSLDRLERRTSGAQRPVRPAPIVRPDSGIPPRCCRREAGDALLSEVRRVARAARPGVMGLTLRTRRIVETCHNVDFQSLQLPITGRQHTGNESRATFRQSHAPRIPFLGLRRAAAPFWSRCACAGLGVGSAGRTGDGPTAVALWALRAAARSLTS